MSAHREVIYLVDDDSRVREALSELLASFGMEVVSFASANEYVEYQRPDSVACLLLDLQLPDISGLDLQQQLARETGPSIIFISGHGDVPSTVRAMKAGAIEFLTKPVDTDALLAAIGSGFAQDRMMRERNADLVPLRRRLSTLTPRERDVLPLIISGLKNKQAAAHLGITEVTLEVHRGQIMRKMAAGSFAELVRMAWKLGIGTPASTTIPQSQSSTQQDRR